MRAYIQFSTSVDYLAALAIDARRWGNQAPVHGARRTTTLERFCAYHAVKAVIYGFIPRRSAAR